METEGDEKEQAETPAELEQESPVSEPNENNSEDVNPEQEGEKAPEEQAGETVEQEQQEGDEAVDQVQQEADKMTGGDGPPGDEGPPAPPAAPASPPPASPPSAPPTNPSGSNSGGASNVSNAGNSSAGGEQHMYVVSEDQIGNFGNANIVRQNQDGSFIIETAGPIDIPEDGSVKQIPQSTIDGLIEDRRQKNVSSLQDFLSNNRNKISQLESAGASHLTKINTAISSARSQVMAAEQSAISKVEADVESARAQTESTFNSVQSQINSAYSSTEAMITTARNTALSKLSTELQTAITNAQAAQERVIEATQAKFDDASTEVVQLAVDMGNTAMQKAQERADYYASLPIPKQGRASRFFEGGDYEKNKHQAKVNACIAVGEGYQKTFNEEAANAAQAFLDAKSTVVSELSSKFTEVFTALQQEHDTKVQEVNASADSALQQASTIKDSALTSIQAKKDAHIGQLEQLRSSKIAEITQQAAQQRTQIESTGQQLRAQFEQLLQQGITGLHQINDQVEADAAEIEKGDPDQFKEFLANGQTSFNTEVDKFETLIAQKSQETGNNIISAGNDGSNALNQLASDASSQISQTQSQFDQDLQSDGQNRSNELTNLGTTTQTQIDTTVSTAVQNLGAIISGAEEQFLQAVEGIGGKLAEKIEEIRTGFQTEIDGIHAKCDTEAQKAADAVQPRWKSVVKFIIEVVIAIAVMVAVAALIAVTGGGILALIGAIAIGVAGGVIKQLANNALDGKPLMEGMGKAAAFGALDGLTAFFGVKAGSFIAGKFATSTMSAGAQFAIRYSADTLAGATIDSIGSGLKEMVNVWSEEGFSISAFFRGFKNDFVKNLVLNAAANGLMEIPPVKRAVEGAMANVIGRISPSSIDPNWSGANGPDVDAPARVDVDADAAARVDVDTGGSSSVDVDVDVDLDVKLDADAPSGGSSAAGDMPMLPPAPEPKGLLPAAPEPKGLLPAAPEPKGLLPAAPEPAGLLPPAKVDADAPSSTGVDAAPRTDVDGTSPTKTDADVDAQSSTSTKTDTDADAGLSDSAIKARNQGLPPAPPGYRYNQTGSGDIYIQRVSRTNAEGELLPVLRIKDGNLEIDYNASRTEGFDKLTDDYQPGGDWSNTNFKTDGVEFDSFKTDHPEVFDAMSAKYDSPESAARRLPGVVNSGSSIPKEVPIAQGDTLYKIVPQGQSIQNSYSVYYVSRAQLDQVKADPSSLEQVLGLPVSSHAATYDVFEIKANQDTSVFQSTIAPTAQSAGTTPGNVYNTPGGGTQTLILDNMNPDIWTKGSSPIETFTPQAIP